MKRTKLPETAGRVTSSTKQGRAHTIKREPMRDLLRRLDHVGASQLVPAAGSAGVALAIPLPPRGSSVEDEMNAAIGCRTSEVALAILAQVAGLECSNIATESDERVDTLLARATAMLGELQPTTATETLLAAQMIGAQRLAMTFLQRAVLPDQTIDGVDRNVARATRLMRLFNEQTETMAKLKGKGGQQRVVVEHVTVASGGQAIVGAVSRSDPGGSQG